MKAKTIVDFTEQLQSRIIKGYDKISRLMWQADEENIYIVEERGYIGYKIPQCFWLIDQEKMAKRFKPSESIKKIYEENKNDYMPATITGTKPHGEKNLTIFDAGEVKAYVDTKLLKEFNGYDVTYKVKTALSAVNVYLYDVLIAIVMPTRVVESK